MLGVNLTHSAYMLHETPNQLVAALLDGLSLERIEIDMINFSGPAMFAANSEVLQSSEAMRK